MSLHQTTVFVGKMSFLRTIAKTNGSNLTSCARGFRQWNGSNHNQPIFRTSCSSSASQQQQQWARVMKLIFGKNMSARQSFDTVLRLLRKQFNVYAAHRLRRMGQTCNLYSGIYSEWSMRSLATDFARQYLKGKRRPFYVLFGGACCHVWEKDKITESELHNRCSDDLDLITEIERLPSFSKVSPKRLNSWEVVIDKDDLRVWKRPIQDTYLYEFKVCGRFTDISAQAFFQVQLDLEYRKVWDKYVIKLDCVDRDEDTGSEVVHWVTHFPFPLQSRDYVFTRRYHVDHRKKTMMFMSRATDHPMLPVSRDHVRVTTYFSQMVIKPHSTFDQKGFNYVLTYHDDPQAMIPTFAVSWITHKGCPDYIVKLHKAAQQLDDHSTSEQICLPAQKLNASKVKAVPNQESEDQHSYSTGSTTGHYA